MRRCAGASAAFLVTLSTLGGCNGGVEHADTTPLEASLSGDTVHLSIALNRVEAISLLTPDQTLDDLPFPTDVAGLPGGGIAVLDRMDRSVTFYDDEGEVLGRSGREGEGPGEYVEPYAVASAGSYLAVWDKNGRLTTLRSDGTVAGTTDAVQGDIQVAWQRVPTTPWEEPLQLSREDVTRRMSPLPDGGFGLLVQDRDERFDSAFVRSGNPTRFQHRVVVVDSVASVVDTLLTLTGQELRLARAPTERTYAWAWERPFPLRPLWASGDDWWAWGHGADRTVTVAFEGRDTLTVQWPPDPRPLGAPDYHHYIDWEIEGYRRTKGEETVRDAADIPRDRWIEEELSVSEERPQAVGLLGDGRCLALAGFRPEQSPRGEATAWVIIDLDDPTEPTVVDVGERAGFVRAMVHGRFYTIEVGEDGIRRVHRFPLPPGACGATS